MPHIQSRDVTGYIQSHLNYTYCRKVIPLKYIFIKKNHVNYVFLLDFICTQQRTILWQSTIYKDTLYVSSLYLMLESIIYNTVIINTVSDYNYKRQWIPWNQRGTKLRW